MAEFGIGQDTFSISCALDNTAHEHLNGADVIAQGGFSLRGEKRCETQSKAAKLPRSPLTLPVVWCRPRAWRSSASEAALGTSILFPSTRNGIDLSSSQDRRPCTPNGVVKMGHQ